MGMNEASQNPLFTVFTPTYNRAHTLDRVFSSLQAQTCRDFEWVVVDDGSTDDTPQLLDRWRGEVDFPIRYFRQENQGKHFAWNRGVEEAQGTLFTPIDSDDGCVPHALATFQLRWDEIPPSDRERFKGITCHAIDQNGALVGTEFPMDPLDLPEMDIRYVHGITGDKWGFIRTEVLREFPMPETLPRRYMPESILWNRISRRYLTRFVNERLLRVWTDAPSMTRGHSPARNAPGNLLVTRVDLNEHGDYLMKHPRHLLRAGANYVRFSMHQGEGPPSQLRQLSGAAAHLAWGLGVVPGLLLYGRDRARFPNRSET